MKTIAIIGRDVREVDALPAAPTPLPPPRSTYRGPSGRIDGPEETQYRAELAELRKRNRENDDANG